MAAKRKINKFNPIKLKNKYKTIQMLAVVVVFGAIGTVVLMKSFAYTATYSKLSTYGCKIYYDSNKVDSTWHPTVQYSSRGGCVKELQGHLNRLSAGSSNPYKLTEDGIFGSKTLAAVKDFQKRRSLVVDGIVGPITWRQIHKVGQICHIGCD